MKKVLLVFIGIGFISFVKAQNNTATLSVNKNVKTSVLVYSVPVNSGVNQTPDPRTLKPRPVFGTGNKAIETIDPAVFDTSKLRKPNDVRRIHER